MMSGFTAFLKSCPREEGQWADRTGGQWEIGHKDSGHVGQEDSER